MEIENVIRVKIRKIGIGLVVKVLLDLVPEPPSFTHLTNPSKSESLTPRRLASVNSWIQWVEGARSLTACATWRNVTIAIPTHYTAIRFSLSRIYTAMHMVPGFQYCTIQYQMWWTNVLSLLKRLECVTSSASSSSAERRRRHRSDTAQALCLY